METYSVPTSLYNSVICRICGSENSKGIYIYDADNEMDLKMMINRYLPMTINDDGKLPRTICPGCHIQLASTVQFFNLIVEGQAKIRELWAHEVSIQKSLEREKQLLSETLDGNPRITFVTDDVATDNNDIVIKIFPSDPFFGESSEMTLLVEGIDKPKRKRGRPRKIKPIEGVAPPPQQPSGSKPPQTEDTEEDLHKEDDYNADDDGGRRLRRRRKMPQRLQEAVAGKELDRVLREEGAIDGYESECVNRDEPMGSHADPESQDSDGAENSAVGEIIGHLQTADGENAEPIIALPSGRAPYRKRKGNRFVCDFCQISFKERTRYTRHRLTHRGLRFLCAEVCCMETFTTRTKLRAHQAEKDHQDMQIVSLANPEEADDTAEDPESLASVSKEFLCGVCGHTATSTEDLKLHVDTHHSSIQGVYVTSTEAESVDTKDGIISESEQPENAADAGPTSLNDDSPAPSLARNSLGKLQCDICRREFNHTSSLLYHKETFHNNGVRFACSKCPKTFSHKQLLQRHQMVHSDTRPFTCLKCGVSFKTKSNLFNHRVVHTGEKKFSCSTCGQTFAHKTSLNLHTIWHQGIRPFKCPMCDKCFTQNGNLGEHMRIHYGQKPYTCEHCSKSFTTSSQHKLHVKRHTGERPWKCQFCSKQFLHKDTWRTHERRHTGDKPFVCSFCHRAFAENWSLKKHIRLHTGEKPYKCQICGKDFADCSNLTKHRKVHGTSNVPAKVVKTEGATETEGGETQQIVYYSEDQEQPFTLEQTLVSQEGVGEVVGQITTFTDEEGNPYQLQLPDGRSVEVLSLDMQTNIVDVRTIEGLTFSVKLPSKHNVADEDLLEQIKEAVASVKPISADDYEEVMEPNHAQPRYTYSNTKSLAVIQAELEGTVMEEEDDGRVPYAEQQEYSIRLAKHMNEPGDFAMDTLKHVYLVAEEPTLQSSP